MAEQQAAATRISRVIKAAPEAVYAAFMDPDALAAWLPPARMTGRVHSFDARVGGGYRMSLFYPPDERVFRGETADREDRVNVRFVELVPPRRIVEAITRSRWPRAAASARPISCAALSPAMSA
jgi:uncharacterized protein YndB with AHSA1/START domain